MIRQSAPLRVRAFPAFILFCILVPAALRFAGGAENGRVFLPDLLPANTVFCVPASAAPVRKASRPISPTQAELLAHNAAASWSHVASNTPAPVSSAYHG